MSKKNVLLIIGVLFVMSGLLGQGRDGYALMPGSKVTLSPGQSITLYAKYISKELAISSINTNDVVTWNVNGKAINKLNAGDGRLVTDLTLSKAVYTAPLVAHDKQPIAVSVTLRSRTGNSHIVLICNVTIRKAQYRITMDAQKLTPEVGGDILLHGECFSNLKELGDGSLMLEPIDNTRIMLVQIKHNKVVDKQGAMSRIVAPLEYELPFLFAIGTLNKTTGAGKAIVYLNSTAPQSGLEKIEISSDGKLVQRIIDIDKGRVTTTTGGHSSSYQLPTAGVMYAMDAVTNLNLLAGFDLNYLTVIKNTGLNKLAAKQKKAWAIRMQNSVGKPDYFKSKQGVKDLQQMEALQKQLGGNVRYEDRNLAGLRQKMTQKMEKDPSYIASADFVRDRSTLKAISAAKKQVGVRPAMAEVTPGTARVRIEGIFKAKGAESFSGSLTNTNGPVQTTLKIKVSKLY